MVGSTRSTVDFQVVCWGDDTHGEASPPAGLVATRVVAGATQSCAETESGWICWGNPLPGIPDLPLEEVALARWGSPRACGRDASSRLYCWNDPALPVRYGNSDFAPDACRTDCTLPRCGDGVVDTGEECDDGGAIGGDGCSAACGLE